nr:GNAT family N-acetyltransferase [Quadrisphaera sp. RL12-1S]
MVVAVEPTGAVVGCAQVRLRGQWFGGARLDAAAVSAVAVDPAHRGRGVGAALVTGALEHAAAAGAVVAALVPSAHRFYAACGFGVAGRRPVFELRARDLLAELPRVRRPEVLRPAEPSDAGAVADLVERRAAVVDGAVDHRWRAGGPADDPSGPGAWVLERDGAVRGWCQLDRSAPTQPGATYDGVVRDLVGGSPDDEVALWRHAVADVPAAAVVHALLPPGSLLEGLLERQVVPVEDGTWMLRLLDPTAALAGRGYPPSTSADVALVLDAPAGGPPEVGLRVTAGAARVGPLPPSAPRVGLAVADLASVFTGHLDPVQARARGLLRCDPGTAHALRGLFAGPPAVLTRSF